MSIQYLLLGFEPTTFSTWSPSITIDQDWHKFINVVEMENRQSVPLLHPSKSLRQGQGR